MHILLVCSANQCRSPLGEVALAARAAERAAPGHRLVGRHPGRDRACRRPRRPSTPPAASGLDLAAHRSACLVHDAVQRADLVIGLERRHVQEVVLRDPAAFGKTFTLKELVRRGDGDRRPCADRAAERVAGAAAQGRRPIDLLGVSPDDDVADPPGRTPSITGPPPRRSTRSAPPCSTSCTPELTRAERSVGAARSPSGMNISARRAAVPVAVRRRLARRRPAAAPP